MPAVGRRSVLLAVALVAAVASSPRADAPSEAAYAKLLIAGLEKAGAGHDLRFDAEHHAIDGSSGFHLETTNLYAEWSKLPADERDAALQHVIRAFAHPEDEKPETFDEVRDRLLPAVRASLYFESPDLIVTDKAVPALPHVAIGQSTGIGIVIDSPDAMRVVSSDDLKRWNVTLGAVQKLALANLRKRVPTFQELEPGVWAAQSGDSYDSSRLVLLDEIRALDLAGGAVALVPTRDLLLLAGAKDAPALLAMARRAEAADNDPRPIHTIALCLHGDRWTECIPDVTPQVRQRYHELAQRGWASIYDEQKDPLQKKLGEDVFVASYSLAQQKATGELTSFAVWSRTVPTLLPHAEMIGFVDMGADGKPHLLGLVPWKRVMAVCGAHLVSDHRAPERWATGTWFPSAAELARMAPSTDLFAP